MGYLTRGNTQMKFQQSMVLATGVNKFPNAWKFGNGWHNLILTVVCVLTNSTGSGAVTDGLYRLIKGISLRLSDGRQPVINVPGIFFKEHHTYAFGVAPQFDTFATTGAPTTYRANIVIPFTTPKTFAMRGQDTTLMTDKLNNMDLQVVVGDLTGLGDLLSSKGDATVSVSMEVTVEQTAKAWNGPRPAQSVEFKAINSTALASSQQTLIDKSDTTAIRRLWLESVNSGTTVPGSGTESDAPISRVTLRTTNDQEYDSILWNTLQAQNQMNYGVAKQTGLGVVDFTTERGLYAAYPAGLPLFQVEYSTGTLSTSFVHCVMENLIVPGLSAASN